MGRNLGQGNGPSQLAQSVPGSPVQPGLPMSGDVEAQFFSIYDDDKGDGLLLTSI